MGQAFRKLFDVFFGNSEMRVKIKPGQGFGSGFYFDFGLCVFNFSNAILAYAFVYYLVQRA